MTTPKQESLKIKLNLPCVYCNKVIFIGDGGVILGKPYHDECFRKETFEAGQLEQKKKFLEMIKSLLEEIGNRFYYSSEVDGVDLKLNELEEYQEFKDEKLKSEVEKI